MTFLDARWLGIRAWIWIYLGISILLFVAVLIWFFRERVKRKYYEIRFPEKIIRIIMHYKGGYYKEYWRLIPDKDSFLVEGNKYNYDDKKVRKENDWFVRSKNDKKYVTILGKDYSYEKLYGIKNRWKSYPELHYFYNCPTPISFDMKKNALDITANQLQEVAENDLFQKLLRLEGEKQMMTILIIIGVINLLISLYMLADKMGWLAST